MTDTALALADQRLIRSQTDGLRRAAMRVAPLLLGVAAWTVGISQLRPSSIGSYGLLASANAWFLVGLVAILAGFVIELFRRQANGWLLGLHVAAMVVVIHAAVPILYGVPEYEWVYKHIGVTQALARYGHITDPTSIYQQWPLFFSGAAALARLGHGSPLAYATWASLGFELAYALLLLGVFRVLTGDRRVAWTAVMLNVFVVSWVAQDYFSPQAFAYLLWLGAVMIVLRWLRAPAPDPGARGRLARLRAPLLAGIPAPPATSRAMRVVAVVLVALIFFAITAAHQLTPYIGLAGIAALTVLDLIRPRWLLLLLAAIAGGYLAPRYGLIAHNFGGLLSGFNLVSNASGSAGTDHAGPEATTALIVRGLAGGTWVLALLAIVRRRRQLGRVVVPAALAFSPFLVLLGQSYGGEAIYRVFLFSAPWCALLVAETFHDLPSVVARRLLIACALLAAMFAGLQGLYGPVRVDAFTSSELQASRWLYAHVPRGSEIVLPVNDFPVSETADYNAYSVDTMPSDPQLGAPTLNESNLGAVEQSVAEFGHEVVYVPIIRAMSSYVRYFGWPHGYGQLVREIRTAPGWKVVYRNADATIYRLDLASAAAAPLNQPRATPTAAATVPPASAPARASSRRTSARTNAAGTTRSR